MSQLDFFTRCAWYMTTYTDTLSVEEWRKVIENAFSGLIKGTNSKKMQLADAKAEILHMVQYYCVEVGKSYRGKMAAHKFRRCNRWDDYHDSKRDPDRFVENEFAKMVATRKSIEAWKEVLNEIPTVDPNQVWSDPRTREGMRVLCEAAKKRYKEEWQKFEPIYASVVSTLSSRPILLMSEANPKGWFWSLDTLRTEGSILAELIFEYGDGLVVIKKRVMSGEENR